MKTIKKFEIRSQRMTVCENAEIYSTPISAPEIAAQVSRQLTNGIDQEKFLVFLLDVKNCIIGYVEAAVGAIDSCVVDPRIVFRAAVHLGASGIIFTHNHPSGDPTPSNEDDAITKRLIQCGKLLDITIFDHIVVGPHKCFSYRASNPFVFSA